MKQSKHPLVLSDTLSRQKRRFAPPHKRPVRIFSCGPSVYKQQHLGNYRTFLYEDILQRYLEYLGHRVRRIINFTDIEDKAIAEARCKHRGLSSLTKDIERRFFADCKKLCIKLPALIPRSSTSVDPAVRIIRVLLEKKKAYRFGGNIYFDPLTYPSFGRLYGLDMRTWPSTRRRFSKDTYPGERWNRGDFILWHGCRAGDSVCWDTALGRGRPAWSIQDPAMILQHLGLRIDICCGGIDNLIRHHDYTRAIMESYSGARFAAWWLHGEHLVINGKKMSKQRGNVLRLGDMLRQGYTPQQIRFFLIDGYYRQKLNMTKSTLERSCTRLAILKQAARSIAPIRRSTFNDGRRSAAADAKLLQVFEQAMSDDLQVGNAIDAVTKHLIACRQQDAKRVLSARKRYALRRALDKIDAVLQVDI